MGEPEKGTRCIELPEHLLAQVDERIEFAGFESADEYITFILQEVLARVEEPETEQDEKASDEIKSRLRSLGYVE